MPISKCAKCSGSVFEVVDVVVRGADLPFTFVQCAQCGTVVTAIEPKPAVEFTASQKAPAKRTRLPRD